MVGSVLAARLSSSWDSDQDPFGPCLLYKQKNLNLVEDSLVFFLFPVIPTNQSCKARWTSLFHAVIETKKQVTSI